MKQLTREEKIQAIYKKIANKDLSFGCKIKTESKNKRYSSVWRISSDEGDYYIDIRVSEWQEYLTSPREWNEIISDEGVLWYNRKIIWHPVMIWDVLDYGQLNWLWLCSKNDYTDEILLKWSFKRKPIDDQPDETVDFIHSLLKDE